MVYGFYNRGDNTQEIIGRITALSRLQAAKHFAGGKQLPLKKFLEIFGIKKLI
jgi:hypothetical protein